MPISQKIQCYRLGVGQSNSKLALQIDGLFATAYAVEVCLGCKPEEATFSQENMRSHLTDCLSSGIMKTFPKMESTTEDCIPRPKSGILNVALFCVCNLPAQFDTDMIACDFCDLWYHCSCMDADVPKYWECPECS